MDAVKNIERTREQYADQRALPESPLPAPMLAWNGARTRALRAKIGAKWSVVLLLIAPAIFGCLYFGPNAAVTLSVTLAACVGINILPRALSGEQWRVLNPGTVITGLLLGLTLSADTPIYMILVGALVAELAGKASWPIVNRPLFNPAALGRGAIAILETYDPPVQADILSSASPLMVIAGGHTAPNYLYDLMFGLTKGAIGETSAIILLAVGVLMLIFVAVKREAAFGMILTAPLLVLLMPASLEINGHAPWVLNPWVYLFGGSTLLMAFFFATDPMTTPRTRIGGWIFGAGAASIGVLGRLYTTLPGCEMWGILIMNFLTPGIDWAVENGRGRVQGSLGVWLGKVRRSDGGAVSFYRGSNGEYHDLDAVPVGDRLAVMRVDGEKFGVLRETLRTSVPTGVIREVQRSGLTGCGGAHFPVATKWQFARRHAGPRMLIINGQEGEADSFKDHALMATEPHLVIEGAALTAFVIEAEEVHVVVNPTAARCYCALESAITDLEKAMPDLPFKFKLVRGSGLYVCGEETAVIEYLEGRRGEPQLRPPFPAEKGLFGRPTVIQNVETVSWLPSLVHGGGRKFRAAGPLKLVSLTGAVAYPGVYVVPLRTTLRDIVKLGGGMVSGKKLKAFAVGGPAGGLLPAKLQNTPLDEGALVGIGAVLGSASIRVLSDDDCVIHECLRAMEFFERETCGRCSTCRIGTGVLRRLFSDMARGKSQGPDSFLELNGIAVALWTGSLCGLGRGVPSRLQSILRYWQPTLAQHVEGKGCQICDE